ncbi:TPA: hypothetical protein VH967_001444, partial [Streptococcus pyogenes]|nr:hypothetical protein [Streptococcus pyogenes]
MLTSKHHNLNKLVWRYGLTSAAAVLLAFGGGASSVKAEDAPMSEEQRKTRIEQIREGIGSYPKVSDSQFRYYSWGMERFNEEEYLNSLQRFTEQKLKDILELIEKGATQGPKGDPGPRGPEGQPGQPGQPG